ATRRRRRTPSINSQHLVVEKDPRVKASEIWPSSSSSICRSATSSPRYSRRSTTYVRSRSAAAMLPAQPWSSRVSTLAVSSATRCCSSLLRKLESNLEFRIAIGCEQIDPLPALQPVGNIAVFQPHRDKEDRALRLFVCHVKCTHDLLLNVATPFGARRETDQNDVCLPHCLDDLRVPVLTREKIFLIQPGMEAGLLKLPIQRAHSVLVLGSVTKKDAKATRRRRAPHGSVERRRSRTQDHTWPVDGLDRKRSRVVGEPLP